MPPSSRRKMATAGLLRHRLARLKTVLGLWTTPEYIHHVLYLPTFQTVDAAGCRYLFNLTEPMRLRSGMSRLQPGVGNPCQVRWRSSFDHVPTWVYPDPADPSRYYPAIAQLEIKAIVPLYNLVGVAVHHHELVLYARTRDDVEHFRLTVTATLPGHGQETSEASLTFTLSSKELKVMVDSLDNASLLRLYLIEAAYQSKYAYTPNHETRPLPVPIYQQPDLPED